MDMQVKISFWKDDDQAVLSKQFTSLNKIISKMQKDILLLKNNNLVAIQYLNRHFTRMQIQSTVNFKEKYIEIVNIQKIKSFTETLSKNINFYVANITNIKNEKALKIESRNCIKIIGRAYLNKLLIHLCSKNKWHILARKNNKAINSIIASKVINNLLNYNHLIYNPKCLLHHFMINVEVTFACDTALSRHAVDSFSMKMTSKNDYLPRCMSLWRCCC